MYIDQKTLLKVSSLSNQAQSYIKTYNTFGYVGFLKKGDEKATGDFEKVENEVTTFFMKNEVDFDWKSKGFIWSKQLSSSMKKIFQS